MKVKHVLCDFGNSTHLSISFNAATKGDRNVVIIHTNTSIMFISYTEISSEISPLAGFVLSNGGRPNNMHWLFSSSLLEYFHQMIYVHCRHIFITGVWCHCRGSIACARLMNVWPMRLGSFHIQNMDSTHNHPNISV